MDTTTEVRLGEVSRLKTAGQKIPTPGDRKVHRENVAKEQTLNMSSRIFMI
jgi:hypothetical protein